MAMLTSGAVSLERTEPRTRTSLRLESIALRHQIAVLERCRTRFDENASWYPVASSTVAMMPAFEEIAV